MSLADGQGRDDLSGRANRNSVKWFSNQEDIKAKKYSYIWAKYSLEDKQIQLIELNLPKK